MEPIAKSHWTRDLKKENEILRKLLNDTVREARAITESRIDKETQYPAGGGYGIGYRACAQETLVRLDEMRSRVQNTLFENGIDLA